MGQNCYDRWLACLASCFVDIVSLKVNTSSMWYIAQIQLRMALCFFLHKPFSQQLFLSCFLSYFYPLIQEGHGWLASGIVVKFVCSIPAAGSLQVGIDHFSAQNTSNLPWPSNLIEAPTHPCVSITSFCFVVLALTSLWNYIVHVFISLLSVSLPILPLEHIRNTSPLRIGTLPVLLIIVFLVLRTLLGT